MCFCFIDKTWRKTRQNTASVKDHQELGRSKQVSSDVSYFIFKLFLFYFVCECFACLCTICIPGSHGSQMRVPDHLYSGWLYIITWVALEEQRVL